MPRVIVTTDPSERRDGFAVLLDEQVHGVHLSSRHGAEQLAERIAWAVADAEDAERRAAVALRPSRRRGDRPRRPTQSRRPAPVHGAPAASR